MGDWHQRGLRTSPARPSPSASPALNRRSSRRTVNLTTGANYTLAADAFGSATIAVTLDDGGTANGGVDTRLRSRSPSP
jgi:hypothetical protein